MGWTSYRAQYYKNGTIDRKAECDAYWQEGLNKGHFEVVCSSMVGSVYYGAIRPLKKAIKDSNGDITYEDIPKKSSYVFGVVFLTKTNMKEVYNFAYKDMDETMYPGCLDCPKKVLDCLTPTTNENAIAWREACRVNILNKKLKPTLSNIPIGTIIQFKSYTGKVYTVEKMAPAYQFRTPWFYDKENNCYVMKKCIPSDFTIIGHSSAR